MSDLERRYTRLLRVFYPADYRREREAEVVGTYLELAGQHRRWPSAGDVADLAAGGLRQRVRAAGATGLGAGLRLAATLALLTASALAGGWSIIEIDMLTAGWGALRPGPVSSLGIVVWAAWLLAAAVHLLPPGRWTRSTLGVAVAVTVAVVPVAAVTGTDRPPLFVLLPQLALGLVALASPRQVGVPLRLLPLAAGATAAFTAVGALPDRLYVTYYGETVPMLLTAAGTALLAIVVLLGIGLAMRGDHRGGWALLVLLGPVGLLALHPLAAALSGQRFAAANPTWSALAVGAVAVGAAGIALVALAVAVHRRLDQGTKPTERCAACGAPTDPTNRPTPA